NSRLVCARSSFVQYSKYNTSVKSASLLDRYPEIFPCHKASKRCPFRADCAFSKTSASECVGAGLSKGSLVPWAPPLVFSVLLVGDSSPTRDVYRLLCCCWRSSMVGGVPGI